MGWVKSCIDLERAAGADEWGGMELDNVDGVLQIVPPAELPGGNWSLTAQDTTFKDGMLCAKLQRIDSTWEPACVVVEHMGQAFYNKNGTFELALCYTTTTTTTTTTPPLPR